MANVRNSLPSLFAICVAHEKSSHIEEEPQIKDRDVDALMDSSNSGAHPKTATSDVRYFLYAVNHLFFHFRCISGSISHMHNVAIICYSVCNFVFLSPPAHHDALIYFYFFQTNKVNDVEAGGAFGDQDAQADANADNPRIRFFFILFCVVIHSG